MKKRHIFLLLLGILFLPSSVSSKPLEEVTLQLRWLHQFQFAGYYMALNKGYYRNVGLNVRILQVDDSRPHPVDEVISGRAQYGIGNSGLINERQNGRPVVVLAALFQNSPNVWIVRKDSNVSTLADLATKRLMMTKNIENAELMALFYKEGIDLNKLNIIENTFNTDDLIDGKIDALNGYSSNEPYYLQKKGIEYTIIDPRKHNINFYSDCLFTCDTELTNHPQRVKAFREASLQGWAYALEHPEEAIDVILRDYSQAKTREHLRYEAAAIRHLVEPDFIEIGHMNPDRWEKIAKIYHVLGFASSAKIPKGFLYDPATPEDNKWLYYLLAAALILLILIAVIAGYIYRLNRIIKEQAIRDSLTGIYNRRYLDETLPREISRASRELSDLSIVMLDLDHFKVINDTYGHAAGDEVLKTIASSLLRLIRQNDFVARFGGEEFIIVMPGMPADQAYERMEECRKEIENTIITYKNHKISMTLSGGISSCTSFHETKDELIKMADDALYESKNNGRNQITLANQLFTKEGAL
ncbi:MAG: diguanylate cyclase [Sulfuricurvum sp.]|nr:diguanylate cyclase [Sulfuricurvum sp.]